MIACVTLSTMWDCRPRVALWMATAASMGPLTWRRFGGEITGTDSDRCRLFAFFFVLRFFFANDLFLLLANGVPRPVSSSSSSSNKSSKDALRAIT